MRVVELCKRKWKRGRRGPLLGGCRAASSLGGQAREGEEEEEEEDEEPSSWRLSERGKPVRGQQTRARIHAEARQNTRGAATETSGSPSPKRLSTTRPATGEGLFLGVCSLMSLDMLHPPNMRGQCKPIYRKGRGLEGRGESLGYRMLDTDLKRLLQYLQGSVFGFWSRTSPFSSTWLDGGDASMD